jgi:3-hydroxy-9,10-secoandrosta-1,3,5(10)-triene-9,17-dione monooxygenase
MRTHLVPRADYRIDDNWKVAGLCGTGNKDIVVDGAFVPEYRSHRFVDAFALVSPGQALNSGALFRLPFGCVFSRCDRGARDRRGNGALDTFARGTAG